MNKVIGFLLKSALNYKGKILRGTTFVLASLLFGYFATWVMRFSLQPGWTFFHSLPSIPDLIWILNTLMMAVLPALMLLLFWHTVLAFLASTLVLLLLAAINHVKIVNLAEPIIIFDIYKLGNISLLLNYISWLMVVPLVGMGACLWLAWKRRKGELPLAEAVGSIVLVCLSAYAFLIPSVARVSPHRHRTLQPRFVYWDPWEDQYRNGFAVSQSFFSQMLVTQKPKGYSFKLVAKALSTDRCKQSSRPFKDRDVVIVMVESLWDSTAAEVALNRDPMPHFHEFFAKNGMIHMISPVFGGTTPNSEFEVLTGVSTAVFPRGAVPFQQYIKRKTFSLAALFSNLKYQTIAVHNYFPSFWNRERVYPLLGFQQFVSLSQMNAQQDSGGFLSDDLVFHQILKELRVEERPAKFIHAVTVNMHSPYDHIPAPPLITERYPSSDENHQQLIGFSNKLAQTDADFGRFIAELRTLKKPPLLLIFGDHQPSVAEKYVRGNIPGTRIPNTRLVPVATNEPQMLANLQNRSLICLTPRLIEEAGLSLSPYFQFVQEQCNHGVPLTPGMEQTTLNDTFSLLVYDRILGEHFSRTSCIQGLSRAEKAHVD